MQKRAPGSQVCSNSFVNHNFVPAVGFMHLEAVIPRDCIDLCLVLGQLEYGTGR